MTINAYDGGAISSGVQRNPNMNLDQKPLKFGVEAKLQPWGHNIREGFEWLEGPRPEWWWTGKKPVSGECPGVTEQGYITSLPLPHLKAGGFTRQDVINYFDNSWTITEVLFSSLQTQESFYRPPYHQLRHPFAFYMLHPAVFYINKYRLAGLINEPINPHFEALFETGVDEMSWDDMSKNNESWPSVKESVEYRSIAYQRILEVLKNHPSLEGKESVTLRDPAWAVFMCFEHERIHIETSSVLMRELPLSLLRRPENFPPLHASAPSDATPFVEFKNEFITIPGGVANLGRGQNVDSFGWDNEFGETKLRINTFQAEKFLCTNAQFWKFVSSGAYIDERYWTPEGWSWRSFRNAKWPTFWVPDGPQGLHKYALRCIFEIIPMPWDWPAVVNYHEAKAYCNWYSEQINKPCRVCTEAEHWLMRDSSCTDENSGPFRDSVLARQDKQTELKSNLNLSYGSESSVTSFPPASTGIYDAMGNVWVWCEDWFSPLDGFRVHPLYDDFSTPCFDNKHSMILGGSFISTGNEASIWARFHFRSHFFQHAGFRVVCGEGGPTSRPITTDQKKRREALENESTSSNPYETMKYLSEYLHLHFSSKEDVIPYDFAPKDAAQFPKRTAIISADIAKKLGTSTTRALDLGCAVGGASFELAKTFSSVVGIDLSESFVNTANILKEKGEMEYFRKDEGDLSTKLTAKVDSDIDRSRTSFRVGDACCLPPDLGDFDLVLTANLLCRLASPKSCLGRMGGLKGIVRPGGLLVNFSPFTWMDDFTNKGAWLGGYYDENGNPVHSRQGLQEALGPEFTLVDEQDVPMLIREHARKYQYIVPHLSVWRRASRKSP